uniref:Uncharacterized protein n=1 Tax=Panagrolaimus superbus TaxID=310955 RepID=A0A914Z767_9BILA
MLLIEFELFPFVGEEIIELVLRAAAIVMGDKVADCRLPDIDFREPVLAGGAVVVVAVVVVDDGRGTGGCCRR